CSPRSKRRRTSSSPKPASEPGRIGGPRPRGGRAKAAPGWLGPRPGGGRAGGSTVEAPRGRRAGGCPAGAGGGGGGRRRPGPGARGKGTRMAVDLTRMRMVIGGKAVDAISGRTFESENPYTGQGWAVVPDAGREDVDAAVAAARSALSGEWGQCTGVAPAALLRRLG